MNKLTLIIIGCLVSSVSYAQTNKTKQVLRLVKTEKIIRQAAKKADIPEDLLLAVCWVESKWNTDIQAVFDGGSYSYSICQVKLPTAELMDKYWKHKIPVTEERLLDPYINAFYAAKYLKYQLSRYENDWELAVDAYNKGTASPRVPNTDYVQKVKLALEERQ
jgi:soluble lytic murein transglycosylase-like protein